MREMTAEQLTETIQAVKEAVDDSDFGPVFIYDQVNGEAKKIVSPLGAQIFVSTLSQILAKSDVITLKRKERKSDLET